MSVEKLRKHVVHLASEDDTDLYQMVVATLKAYDIQSEVILRYVLENEKLKQEIESLKEVKNV